MTMARETTGLPAILKGFPGSALELSADGFVLESNGKLEVIVGRDVIGLSFGELLDSTSQLKWARMLGSRGVSPGSALWELVLQGSETLELRTFAAIWARELDVDSLWLLEYARDIRLESLFEEFAAANSELLATHRDLAKERGRLTRALASEAAARAEAENAVRVRDEVLSIVAHDLRNPLDRIVACAPMLHESLPEESRAKLVAVIERTAKSMNRLISDLLDAAGIEAGRLAIDVQPVEVAMLVDNAVDNYQRQASDKGLTLTGTVSSDIPPVSADAGRVQQTLANLIGNAVRLVQPGGRVAVTAELVDSTVRFAVADSGPGISSVQLPHLFERFWQAQTNRRGGAGLGLAIAKGIVEAHGGRIWVESVPGTGSTFYFTLPVHGCSKAETS